MDKIYMFEQSDMFLVETSGEQIKHVEDKTYTRYYIKHGDNIKPNSLGIHTINTHLNC